MRDPRQDSGIVDLVSVQMQDRQNRAITDGIEEFVDMPRGCQRAGFRLAIANHGSHNQVWIIEGSATGMREHITQLTSFMNRARSFRRAVAPNAAGKGKLLEELAQATFIFTLVG